MRWIAVMCAGLLGCAPSSEPGPVAQLRQAFPGLPEFIGEPGSLLGSSLTACPGNGFVAGAPGIGSAWFSDALNMPAAVGDGLGRTVACQRIGGVAVMLAGGGAGVRKDNSGVWTNAFTAASTTSLSRSDAPTLPLLVGGVGTVHFFNPITRADVGTPLVNLPGSGSQVLWMLGHSRFLVSSEGRVERYTFDPLTNKATLAGMVTDMASGFGKAMAVGELLPSPGEEVAIAADGKVFIYSATGLPVLSLSGTEDSFGAALAIQREYGVGLDALLVGEPSLDQVHRFIGSAGTVVSSLPSPGSRFGASLAVDPVNTVAIGAPEYQGSGAVFFERLGGPSRTGDVQSCVAGAMCRTRSNCVTGVCVGGVYCDTSLSTGASACDVGDRCVVGVCVDTRDAGVVVQPPDSGVFPSMDAGTSGKDAGSEEAGATMEPLLFSTSGCSAGGALPVVLMALAMLFRRR